MWIEELVIENFRLYPSGEQFIVENFNIPDGNTGSGLTLFVGENGCGKTSLLDALALPFLTYKSDSISIEDFNDPHEKIIIEAHSQAPFEVSGTMPNGSFQAVGFQFEAGIRSREVKAYLSSIVVSDQKFIKEEGADKPKDGSPDLRVSVNNPFKGKRFDENDFLYLDKSRTYQTRSGTYNQTRFDRIMEDFNYQYIKKNEEIGNLNEQINAHIKSGLRNDFLAEAISKFKVISGIDLKLDIIDNWKPFSKASFVERKENNLQINLESHGSGYEMIFSLIYSFFLSQQSKKQLIALIDEPELHLHPKVQNDFVEFLLESSKESQIILTSHSPLLVKQLMQNKRVKIQVIKKENNSINLLKSSDLVLPYLSSNEINYVAFDLASVEFHNELYGRIQEVLEKWYEKEIESCLQEFGVPKIKKWQPEKNGEAFKDEYEVTLQTFIRNKIHHPENKLMQKYNFTQGELLESIQTMKKLLDICPT